MPMTNSTLFTHPLQLSHLASQHDQLTPLARRLLKVRIAPDFRSSPTEQTTLYDASTYIMIESKIEIAAPAATVRQVLLDFDRYPAWHTGFINLLQPEDSAKSLVTLQPGDKVKCDIDGMKFTAEIKENSDELFQWQGPPVMGLIAGLHGFHMKPTESGGTFFTQSEEFSGLIAFTMHPSLLGGLMVGKFAQFNKDLKARAEKLQETQETS